ncbi:MAG: hypothetical protein LBM98_06390 [Oscillospiraceae bacterium]|nr:hypothetical protein [Oscillospiraceae bacterium]
MRYVPVKPARQSSAGSVTYVSCPPGTGLLRACNIVRIASAAALAKTAHGAGTQDVRRGQDAGTGLGLLRAARNDGAPFRRPSRNQTSKPPSLIFDI